MKINHKIFFIYFLFALTGILFSLNLCAQNFPVDPKQKKTMVVVPKKTISSWKAQQEAVIDSLTKSLNEYQAAYANAAEWNDKKDSTISELDQKIIQLQTQIKNLDVKNKSVHSQNLKLDQSNRILILFNAIVGVLLLITLVWFLRNIGKKKTPAQQKLNFFGQPAEAELKNVSKNNLNNLEHILEQLERLNKLKEKGVLTDKEFLKQKHQVLGEHN